MKQDYEARYQHYQELIETALAAAVENKGPEPLHGAMTYSLLSGGKRLRPVLLLAAYEAGGGKDVREAVPYACAVEIIHTYSLIHDDLPAMDDDDLRRGRPSNHKVFGEAIAILAGDGLLTLAFEMMLDAAQTPVHLAAMRCIAQTAMSMVEGQSVDVTCEKEGMGGADELVYIHRHKTADLFMGAAQAGLLLAGASQERVEAGGRYGEMLGMAFQIRDDLLDVLGDMHLLGKATGMDIAHGKLTWPGVFGLEAAKQAGKEKTQAALSALEALGGEDTFLRELAVRLLERDR